MSIGASGGLRRTGGLTNLRANIGPTVASVYLHREWRTADGIRRGPEHLRRFASAWPAIAYILAAHAPGDDRVHVRNGTEVLWRDDFSVGPAVLVLRLLIDGRAIVGDELKARLRDGMAAIATRAGRTAKRLATLDADLAAITEGGRR